VQRNLAGGQPPDTQRTLPFLLRFSELLLSRNQLSCAGRFHTRWIAGELRAALGAGQSLSHREGERYPCRYEGFGQAGVCRGCSAQRSAQTGEAKPLSVPFWVFFTTALRCKRSCTHTEWECVWRILACFAYTFSCVNLHVRVFLLHFLERNPSAMHRLVREQPTPLAFSIHTSACTLLNAHIYAHVCMQVFTLHHHVPTEQLAHAV